MANKSVKSIILPVIVVVLAFAILYCVNLWTYPTIVQARMQGEVGSLQPEKCPHQNPAMPALCSQTS